MPLSSFTHDLRGAWRSLRHAPGFTATIVLTLGLGIGACTAVYSALHGVLLHPIGHDPHPENEIRFWETQLPRTAESRVSAANFLDWQQRAKSFSSLRAGAPANLTLTGAGEPVKLVAARATHEFLEVHAWPLALGRGFLPEEDRPGHDRVIIISHALWQNALGGDRAAIGRSLLINGEPRTLVGVISEEVGRFSAADAFIPMAFTDAERAERGARTLGVWGRLKPGVTLEQARAEMNLLCAQLAAQHPDTNHGWGALLRSVVEIQGAGGLREAMWLLLGAVGCVLLIACANVANLLLARASTRHRELAVRAALGAGRGRLLRELLAESLLLAALGGACGVAFTWAGLQLMHGYAAPGMQRLGYLELNVPILAFALSVTAGTGAVFGLAPAWLATRVNLNDALKQGSRGATEGRSRRRLRGALVTLEVALCLVLLTACGALVRRLIARANLDPGFGPERVMTLQLGLAAKKYPTPARQLAFAEAALERLRAVGGVESAAATTALPLPQGGVRVTAADNATSPRDEWTVASHCAVTPDYFSTLGIRLARGRVFSPHDDARAGRVAVINETLARQLFAGADPIGRQIVRGGPDSTPREIVGVVADIVEFGAETAVSPQLYEPFTQAPAANFFFVVRATGEPRALATALKPQIYAVDPEQPVLALRPLPEIFAERIAGQRFAMHLLSAFAGLALIIAAIGIYAVVSYTVNQRTTEIGVRIALGAQRRDVLRLVLAFAARVIGLGLIVGVAGAFAFGRSVESLLYQVNARDPVVLGVITLLLALTGLVACLLPARRAMRVDPIVALRNE